MLQYRRQDIDVGLEEVSEHVCRIFILLFLTYISLFACRNFILLFLTYISGPVFHSPGASDDSTEWLDGCISFHLFSSTAMGILKTQFRSIWKIHIRFPAKKKFSYFRSLKNKMKSTMQYLQRIRLSPLELHLIPDACILLQSMSVCLLKRF